MNQVHRSPTALLQNLIHDEERQIKDSVPSRDRPLMLLELCRASDMFFLTTNQHPDELVSLYRHGCNRAIKLFWDGPRTFRRAPLFPSSPETMRWANALIQHCGKLSLCEQLVEHERCGLGELTVAGPTLHFRFTARHLGIESVERNAFGWVGDLIHTIQQPTRQQLNAVEPHIRDRMRSMVRRWGNHFIAYETTPEIDSFFQDRGILEAQKMFGQDSFHADARFGNQPFSFYRALVSILIGWGLKHITFASLLVELNPDLLIQNQITLTADIDKFAGYMADALGVTMNEAQLGLAMVVLDSHNTQCCIPGNVPPPLIRASAEQYLKLPSGMLNGPFYFMLRNLRLQHRTDWDRAVNDRESIFRDELYALFPQERLIKIRRAVRLKRNGKSATDIDGVVIDPANRVIGLFQLKWQDSFESSMKERFARLSNFVESANEWISIVRAYIGTAAPNEMARILGVSPDLASNVSNYRLFVIGRHFAHFSGDTKPDSQVAWGLWPQVLRLIHDKYDYENPIAVLHSEIQKDSPFLKPPPVVQDYVVRLTSHKVFLHASTE